MAYPNAQIYQLGPRGAERVAYEETEHFRVTRGSLNNHRQALQVLLEE